MSDFEKLGVFYLGQQYDLDKNARGGELTLYDAKDLTTHAMIIGMTGSGKTGLGIGIIEEAAIDRIPVIAIDPKGDLGNLLLNFPDLQPEDFKPWVSSQEAANKGVELDAFAASTAEMWKKGLTDWGEDGARIQRLRDAVDMAIYTPGSSAGIPISVLQSFKAPAAALRDDDDLYRERIQTTATSVLGLMGIEADPITSREHVLIANIIQQAWGQNQDLDIAGLIHAIQQPPFTQIGVLDVDSFFPQKERASLAMKLNMLLASPGFEAWMQGEPLDTARLLFTAEGKPRISVMSIAHLSETERMFFVSMLLSDIVSWMRAQPGTGSLRALLYMDELVGYMPPVANPPSKPLFLTLLKQARAFGLGIVLSTQNPVDLDYKGLSNMGTWFIGRLQTERDKARVIEGLQGATGGGGFDRQEIERILAGLGKRVFLLRNAADDHPEIFTTRWVLSYLAGPLTRDQIRQLMAERKARAIAAATVPAAAVAAAAAPTPVPAASPAAAMPGAPPTPAGVRQYFLPSKGSSDSVHYKPMIVGLADISYASAKYSVQETRRLIRVCPINDGPLPVNWEDSKRLEIPVDSLAQQGAAGATYDELPATAANAKSYADWGKQLARWLRSAEPIALYQSARLKATSRPGETEGDFRIRLQQIFREQRDAQVEVLRKKYASRLTTLQDRLQRAQENVAKYESQSSQHTWGTMASIGGGVIGAIFGRKKVNTAINKGVNDFNRMQKGIDDAQEAQATAADLQNQLTALEQELQGEIDKFDASFDAQTEPLETVQVLPKSSDVQVHFVGLAWAPYLRDAQGILSPAWG